MGNYDHLTKGRIKKLHKQINDAGLTVPALPNELSLDEQEAVLKVFLKDNRPPVVAESAFDRLRKKADLLGVYYDDMTEESALADEVSNTEVAMREESEARTRNKQVVAAATNGEGATVDVAREMGKEIGREIAVSIAAQNKAPGTEREVSERDYDPTDLVEMKTYFVPMIYWKLPSKRVGGQVVKPPFGKIEFKMLEGESVRVGSRNQTRYMCAYSTNSRKEQAYMDTHPLFRKAFYPSDNDSRLTSDELKYALKFGECSNMLLTYQAPDLYRIANSPEMIAEGMRVGTNMSLSAIRDEVAGIMARKAVREEKENINRLIQESGRRELLSQTA